MQKQQDTRLAENKIGGCEQKPDKLKFTSLTISPGTAAFRIMKLLWVQLYSRQSIVCFDHAQHQYVHGRLRQSKHDIPAVWMHLSVDMSVVCADLRLEFDGKTIAGLSMAS